MKIGITCYPTVGGSGVIATELGKMLAVRGHEIHFITSHIPFRLEKEYENIFYHEVEVNDYPVFQYPPYDLSLTAKMAEVMDKENLDILHVHYALPHAISAIMAKDMAHNKAKIITTLHGTDITVLGIDPAFKKLIQYGIEKSDAVTAVSNSLALQTKEMIEVKSPISVIYNFVNENEYYPKEVPNLKRKYEIEEDEKILIHISNFRKVKRVQDVIRTFYLVQQDTKSKLLLIGDGPELEFVKHLVYTLQLEDKVLFLGKKSNISDFLSIADLILLLSEKESFGLVLLEAMSCGVPAIGTNIGGIPEVIAHRDNGYIVEKGNIEEAAKYANEILQNNEKHRTFKKNAVNYVNEFFHSDLIVEQYLDLYRDLLD